MKKLALCIGNNEYKVLPKLSCCIADAAAMEEQLKSLGFDTILRINLNREDMANSIFEFSEKIEQYDAALLYYAGHGFQVDGDNILAPIDLDVNNRAPTVRMNAFPMSELMSQLNKYPEQTKIVILDACRETLGYRGGFQDFAPVLAPQGSVIAFATSPGQSAKENSSTGHGKYTEALLQYISLPRVPVETVFKKVREALVARTGGAQIPWEHTSLIGEFYLNSDTIYDGISYSLEAKADSRFHFASGGDVKVIVEGLKSYNWPTQEQAISNLVGINFACASGNELFVLGRNIYQAACGNSFACQRFLNNFGTTSQIPNQAKLHILNGMAYEIYYDSSNRLRDRYKLSCFATVVKYLEQSEYYASREFIASNLCRVEDRPIYIPGQNELMYMIVKSHQVTEGHIVDDIIYQGRSILRIPGGNDNNCYNEVRRRNIFEQKMADCIAATTDCLRIQYDDVTIDSDTSFILPSARFSLRFGASQSNSKNH